MRLSTHRHFTQLFGYTGMALLVILIGVPLLWLISGSMKTNAEYFTANPTFISVGHSLRQLCQGWVQGNFSHYYLNSVVTTFLGAAIR